MPSTEIRAAIKSCQGTLSQAQAAKQFGVSRRTVGRIYNDGELSKDKYTEINALREQVAQLSKLVLDMNASSAAQRHRKMLNPSIDYKSFQSHPSNYSSPYRDRAVTLYKVYGVDVPMPWGWEDQINTPWFLSEHPASPSCLKYPYPAFQAKKGHTDEQDAAPVTFRDPPIGTACMCNECKSWRRDMAFEAELLRSYSHAVAELAVFRAGR